MTLPSLRNAASIKRRQVVLTVSAMLALVGVIVLGLYLSDPRRGEQNRAPGPRSAKEVLTDYRTPSGAIDPGEIWIEKSEARLSELQKHDDDLQRQIEQLTALLERDRNGRDRYASRMAPPPPGDEVRSASAVPSPPRESPAFPTAPLPPPPDIARAVVPAAAGFGAPPPVMPDNLSGIVEVSFAIAKDAPPGGAKENVPTVRDTLPAGGFGGVVLLNGLDAPTGGIARTNPIPVLMRLLDNGTLPNGFRSRIQSCFVTGAGYGDLSAERAYIRLEILSCVLQDGKIVSQPVEGYVAGEDGKNGLRGRVISKQGQMIGRALFAGIAGGLGQSIAQSYSSISVSPLGSVQTVDPDDVAKVGVATGVGRALEKIADFYIARANELYPVIEIDSSRRGDVILTNTVALGPTFAEAWNRDE